MNRCYYDAMNDSLPEPSAEETLIELNAIFESITDGIYVTDGEGLTLRVNKAFEEITNITATEIVGHNVQDLIDQGVYEKSVSLIVMQTHRSTSIVETLKNGKEVLLTGTPLYDDEGKLFRIVTTLRDVADLNVLKTRLAMTEQKSERYRMELLTLRLNQLEMDNIVISSPEMKNIMRTALQLAEVDSTVLITGESGVGKEIITRAIHRAGRGDSGPLITANCGAIPESLLESELFGYEKGAFTGADRGGKPGLFEVARGGTLFLDEIGDVNLNVQVKLLRALQEKEIMRVGGRKPISIDVRIITATNRDLKELVSQGAFRKDLYYRLNVVPLHVPPLRERQDAVLPLVNHFLDQFNKKFGKEARITGDALKLMEFHDWPGNVRELENTLERLVVLSDSSLIRKKDLPDALLFGGDILSSREIKLSSLGEAKAQLERRLFSAAWKKFHSTRKVAATLEISQSTAVRKLNQYEIYTEDENPIHL